MLAPTSSGDLSDPGSWGMLVSSVGGGRQQAYVLDLGGRDRLLTFVTWADDRAASLQGPPYQNRQ